MGPRIAQGKYVAQRASTLRMNSPQCGAYVLPVVPELIGL